MARRSAAPRSSEITPEPVFRDRRAFLSLAGGAIAALTTGVWSAQQPPGERKKLLIAKRRVTTTDPLTPFESVTTYNNFYEFGGEKSDPSTYAGAFHPAPWSVTVDGECARPGVYALEDILKGREIEERVY